MFTKVNNRVMLSDSSYSFGKKLVQVYIPAVSALYFGLSSIWGLPATEQVVGTLAVFATFLGVCLGLSSKQYDASEARFDGNMVVQENEETGKKVFSLQLDGDPKELADKEAITFKVSKP